MRVDVRGGRSLRVPCPVAHRFQRNPRREQKSNVCVPQGVNRNLRQVSPRDEVVKPTRDAIWVNRCAVVLCKNTVAIDPALSNLRVLQVFQFQL